jgi:hypothetical protein
MKNLLLLALYFLTITAYSQKLKVSEVDLPLSKAAQKKGMYVNTTLTKEGNIRSFVAYDLKKGQLGFDAITFDKSGKLIENASEVANSASISKYEVEIPAPGKVKIPGLGVDVLRLVTSNGVLGKLKVESGGFKPVYRYNSEQFGYVIVYTPVLKGFRYKDKMSTESDMRLNIFAAHSTLEDNLGFNYNILEGLVPNTIGYYNQNSKVAIIGKNAQWDVDSPNGSNVVISGQFDGATSSFTNIKEHVLDYNQRFVVNGYDGKWNRSILVSTLNAPASVAAWKKFQSKDVPYMTYMTMGLDGNVIDNVTFKSKSVRGNFGIYGFEDTHFVLGNINGKHVGYCRNDVGSATDFQIVKIKNGKVEMQKTFSYDQLAGMVTTPGGKKGKLKFSDITISRCIKTPNGEFLAIAFDAKGYYLFQFDNNIEINKVYVIPRIPGGAIDIKNFESGTDLYLVFKSPLARGFKKGYVGYGLMKTVDFSRVDEAMTFARIVKINPDQKTCSEPVDFLDDVIMGEDTIFEGLNGGLIMPVKDGKGNFRLTFIN